MLVRGDGWEVGVQEVTLAGRAESWRPVVFFMALMANTGIGIQVWYLDSDGKLAVATSNKLRQVGV